MFSRGTLKCLILVLAATSRAAILPSVETELAQNATELKIRGTGCDVNWVTWGYNRWVIINYFKSSQLHIFQNTILTKTICSQNCQDSTVFYEQAYTECDFHIGDTNQGCYNVPNPIPWSSFKVETYVNADVICIMYNSPDCQNPSAQGGPVKNHKHGDGACAWFEYPVASFDCQDQGAVVWDSSSAIQGICGRLWSRDCQNETRGDCYL